MRRNEAFWSWFEEFARPKLEARKDTFAEMFEHLDSFDRPVTIVETGCCRSDPNDDYSWKGDGCSTILFDRYVTNRGDGSAVFSVDIDPEAVERARRNAPNNARIVCGDSIAVLARCAASGVWAPYLPQVMLQIDLLYLDSMNLEMANPLPSAVHHHNELVAAMPMIRPDTLVVVDDSPPRQEKDVPRIEVFGKGQIVALHMDLCGADFVFCNYQAGWKGVRPLPAKTAENDLQALLDRARAHIEANHPINAERLYRLILGLTTPPESGAARVAHGEACAFYAKLAATQQRFGVAADWYREAIQADPLGADYRIDLVANALLPMGAKSTAEFEAEKATKIAPDYWRTWHIYGGVAHANDVPDEAVRAYDRELQVADADSRPDAMLDRASIAIELADYETALKMTNPVLDTDRRADALHCLAMIAYRQHRHEEAIEYYHQAIAGECRDLPMAHWNMSLALHSIGRYREGYEAHHWRGKAIGNAHLSLPMRRFTLPLWNGEPPEKEDGSPAVVHVHAEAGHGDNIAVLRYLRLMKDRGYVVRYEVADGMLDLFSGSFPDIECFPKAPDYPGALGIKPFDYHLPVGELPYVFKTDIDTIPWFGPYVKADPILSERYRARLQHHRGPKIGVCWSGGIRAGIWMKEYGLRKSMHLSKLVPAMISLTDEDCLFVNVQVGPERGQIEEVQPPCFIDVLPKKPSWADTAALIDNLDLMLVVDTAVAHLCGAMGKPTWMMTQRDCCSWHFMCWRPGAPWNEASPWYPSIRIFRKREFEQPHFWDDVIADVTAALRSFAAGWWEAASVAAE